MLPIQYIRIMGFVYQGAVPQIIEKTTDDFFSRIIGLLRKTADICFDGLADIPCIACPHKPEGAMSVMVREEYVRYYELLQITIWSWRNF